MDPVFNLFATAACSWLPDGYGALALGDKVENEVRSYLDLRQQLLPYIYSEAAAVTFGVEADALRWP